MELKWSIILAVIVPVFGYLVIQCLVILIHYINICRVLRKIPHIPGHWLYGNSRELYAESSKSFLAFSMRVMEETNARMFVLWIGVFPFIQICHPDTFKQLAHKVNTKDKRLVGPYRLMQRFIGDGLLGSNGKKWARNRKLLTPAFHFSILSGYISVMNEVTETLLDKLETVTSNGESVDMFPYVRRATLDALVKCSLSYDGNFQNNQNADYTDVVQRILELVFNRYITPWKLIDCLFYMSADGREMKRLCDIAHTFTGSIIKARQEELEHHQESKTNRHLDFLDILLTARDEEGNGLTAQEIQDEVDTFTFAGHDTTASAISWAIYALGLYPEYQERVYQDVRAVLGDNTKVLAEHLGKFSYLTLFVKESMRYYTAVPGFTRHNEDTIVIDGIEIPSGCGINVQAYLIHHNEHIWPNHNVFNPERFDVDHRDEHEVYGLLPFSAGSRNCIGQVFAMNEVKITIAKLVNRYEIVRDPDHDTDILPEIVLRPSDGINVFLKSRET